MSPVPGKVAPGRKSTTQKERAVRNLDNEQTSFGTRGLSRNAIGVKKKSKGEKHAKK